MNTIWGNSFKRIGRTISNSISGQIDWRVGYATLFILIPAIFPTNAAHAETLSASASAEGWASYYSDKFRGRKTASGERYNPGALTAVHPFWPFGTKVRVTNIANSKSVEVRINDRCAKHNRRLLDLSKSAAREIGMLAAGLSKVRVEVLHWGRARDFEPATGH